MQISSLLPLKDAPPGLHWSQSSTLGLRLAQASRFRGAPIFLSLVDFCLR